MNLRKKSKELLDNAKNKRVISRKSMIINGEKFELKELKFMDFIKEKGYKIELIALELNGEIIPKSEFENLILKENDKAEIVSFVGGG